MEESYVRSMAVLRMLSSAIELTAALLMIRTSSLDAAIRINASLGLVGPIIFILVSAVGLAGLAGAGGVSPSRIVLIVSGLVLVFMGTTSRG